MAKEQFFLDPETGVKRKRDYCLAEDCVYDTFWSEHFDAHYFHKHEIPAAQKRALTAAADRVRERAERMKPRTEIPIVGRR